MIIEYHRPQTLEETLRLLSRKSPLTLPLAGGTVLNRPSRQEFAVVDLQALGLDKIEPHGEMLHLGATTTLQAFLDWLEAAGEEVPMRRALQDALRHEATRNLRQVGSLAGTLVSADGRSPFTTAMLALDARLTLLPEKEEITLGDLLPLRVERLHSRLITRITLPLHPRLAYRYVARTPADRPIVCASLARWPSGRVRLALGGYGEAPLMAFDGPGADGLVAAAQSAYHSAGDEWASAEYRSHIAGVLAQRCLEAERME